MHIDVIDPYPAGPGHVWQPAQSRLYLMNTQSFYPTVVPEDPELAAPLAGGTFDRWRELQRRDPHAALSAEERTELAGLESADFPSRALYGRYLRATLEELLEKLPDGVTVEFHPTTATAVRPGAAPADAVPENAGFDVALADGAVLSVGSVVLALGHLESRLNPEQRDLQSAAQELGLTYLPPAAPADVDWSRIPAVRPVLVRGMGLNFFDAMGQLTEGRGGKFLPDPDGAGLTYLPSGPGAAPHRRLPARHPVPGESDTGRLLPGVGAAEVLHRGGARHIRRRRNRAEFRPRPLAAAAPGRRLGLLLHPGALAAGRGRRRPGRLPRRPGGSAAAARPLHGQVGRRCPDGDRRVTSARPIGWTCWASQRRWPAAASPSRAELDAAVVEYLLDDARRSALGEEDPVKMAIGALHHGRAVLKTAVADGGITDESWVAGTPGLVRIVRGRARQRAAGAPGRAACRAGPGRGGQLRGPRPQVRRRPEGQGLHGRLAVGSPAGTEPTGSRRPC